MARHPLFWLRYGGFAKHLGLRGLLGEPGRLRGLGAPGAAVSLAHRKRPSTVPAGCTWQTHACGASAHPTAGSGSSRHQVRDGGFVSGYAGQRLVEVVPGEPPVEGLGHGVGALLESSKAGRDRAEVEEIVGGNDFSPDHGEVDLCVVEPGSVLGQTDEPEVVPPRCRCHPTLRPCKARLMDVEHEYDRRGAVAYIATHDVHRAQVFGRCEDTTGNCPLRRLCRAGDDNRILRERREGVLGSRQRQLSWGPSVGPAPGR